MTLKELIAAFRTDALDRVAPYLWDDPTVTRFLNEAENEACIRQKLIREKSDPTICRIDVRQGISTYNLDQRVIDIDYASLVFVGSENMLPYVLGKTTSAELDTVRPLWRVFPFRPQNIICYDTKIEVDCVPDTDYVINIEAYRLPMVPMKHMNDCPEINPIHHRHLVKWALFRAFSMPDADTFDGKRAEIFESQFDEYFGKRPDANNRRRQNASRPHRNRAVW
jgi:hypothetical protein